MLLTSVSIMQSKVVVITGASSGLGREAALEFARRGAALVLGARRLDALADTARLCREAGANVAYQEMDVTSEAQVKALAERAMTEYGRIDVWVNNAGVTLFSLLENSAFAEHRRVIETNLYGAMYGARAVVPIFKRQKQGTLINVGSVLSKIGQPFVPSYVISKFALRGLSEALRSELADYPGVHICSLYPYAIDTPHFQSGANRIGRQARAMPPVQSPERVARALVDLARRPRRELHVPRIAALGLALHALLPTTVERLLSRALEKWHFDENTEQKSPGNLYTPADAGPAVHGERQPQITAPTLASWAAQEFVKIQAEAALRWAGRWGTRARNWPASDKRDPLTRAIRAVP
ncbi:MAG TPA: SDR family oxidoreductase [Polyangiaceae bacterium]|nr:SDR family oxidoreductase [Polyangiaceae bacterium]